MPPVELQQLLSYCYATQQALDNQKKQELVLMYLA